ncbi:MAG: MgtC/SapB family protein [Methylobacter sp.]|uniref:MgtC/SapB family protein n=1 Tax=Candidatus Methylobacter titanis TaxID=3053457 RepID=A0AA43TKQ6_9GAMM|nr:MgtC/SapB family protein [Candidatus Methylobacter titanis]
MTEIQQTFYFLSVSLAIGLLIGVERGWKDREAEEGHRIAGVRTYGLIGLMGGVCCLRQTSHTGQADRTQAIHQEAWRGYAGNS